MKRIVGIAFLLIFQALPSLSKADSWQPYPRSKNDCEKAINAVADCVQTHGEGDDHCHDDIYADCEKAMSTVFCLSNYDAASCRSTQKQAQKNYLRKQKESRRQKKNKPVVDDGRMRYLDVSD